MWAEGHALAGGRAGRELVGGWQRGVGGRACMQAGRGSWACGRAAECGGAGVWVGVCSGRREQTCKQSSKSEKKKKKNERKLTYQCEQPKMMTLPKGRVGWGSEHARNLII